MHLKGLNDYDIVNYCKPSMFLIFPKCSFKCDKEFGRRICQNSALANEPAVSIDIEEIYNRYKSNILTHACVCGGLEPFDSWTDLYNFIHYFRQRCDDDIVIYTGYTEEEIVEYIRVLHNFSHIIVKFGRFMPNRPHIYDALLGVTLASDNQYAKIIS